jgi:uncharacterized flavoprotein (TIGR03862 family)
MSKAAVIGGGPAGLMAAETLAGAGVSVDLFETMPTVGRKLLMAGRGGLNLTHSEDEARFLTRYGTAAELLRPALADFGAAALRDWTAGLGIETFVGSSGRIFPRALKASPLLRAWLARLNGQGVRIHTRHRWIGFDTDGGCRLMMPSGPIIVKADAIILALGGASWPRLGSDGAWAPVLAADGLMLAPFRPANCGVVIDWSERFRERWAGTPVKTIVARFGDRIVPGDAIITDYGLEGGAIYALGSPLRDAVMKTGGTELYLDLRPGVTAAVLAERLSAPRRGASLGNFLRKAGGLSPAGAALLREAVRILPGDPAVLAKLVKQMPLRLTGAASLARAISTGGGVVFDMVDENFMIRTRPGCYVVGEMLDWEAPTGGYLLQACFATGRWAAHAAARRLARR